MEKRKNGKIELIRFIFTMFIVFYHCQRHYLKGVLYAGHFTFFARGYIGVEFFFLVTGFFMARTAYKYGSKLPQTAGDEPGAASGLGRETASFVWRKMKAILPYHFSAFGIILAVTAIYERQSAGEVIKTIFNSVPGLLLFSKTGFNFGNLNRVEWYLIAMIFTLMILYPLCRKYYSMYVYVMAPVGGMFILGYLTTNFGSLVGGGASTWNGAVYTCMLRALAEISLGASCFEFARRLQEISLTKRQKLFLTAAENGCYLFSFLFVISNLDAKYSIYALLALFLAVGLTISGITYGSRMFDNRVCYFLGSSSLIVYLSQVLPLDMVKALFPDSSGYGKTLIMVLLTLANAVLCSFVVKAFRAVYRKYRSGR